MSAAAASLPMGVLAALLPLAAAGVVAIAVLLLIVATAAVARPWDGAPRSYSEVRDTPYPVFWVTTRFFHVIDRLASLKPAPFRVPEIAAAYVQSQVLFTLNNLSIADLLRARGPLTAAQIAAELGPQANAEWIERLLSAAAAFGLITRRRARPPAGAHAAPGAPAANGRQQLASKRSGALAVAASADAKAVPPAPAPAPAGAEELAGDTFQLNAASALLCKDAPCAMFHFVKLLEDNAEAMGCLSEAMLTGAIPYSLTPAGAGGGSFWDRLRASGRHGTTFDGAMRQKDHLGGGAIVAAYPWHRFDRVFDVAGGNGQLLASLLRRCPRLTGTLVDQKEQVARGQQWWAEHHAALLPRAAFAPGNIFDASSLPPPGAALAAAGGGGGGGRRRVASVAYVLSDILHDWSDADALAILRALRQAAAAAPPPAAAAAAAPPPPAVKLLLIEAMLCDSAPAPLSRARAVSDVTMLSNFGGKERGEPAFARLLAAAGWRLQRVLPAAGLFSVIEAVPV